MTQEATMDNGVSLMDATVRQTPRQENVMICQDCRHWVWGTVGCRAGYFIATYPAYIPQCHGFKPDSGGHNGQ